MRDGAWKDKYLVDVKGLDGTNDIAFDPDRGLTLGDAVNMNRVTQSAEIIQHYPLLVEAALTVASYQLRNRATIAGNICNASPAGDTIGACMVFDSQLRVHGTNGVQEEPLSTFFLGPGKTRLQPGDIATAVMIPLPKPGSVGRYIKLNRNALGDLAIVGVTVLGYPDDAQASGFRFRIVLASVAPVPLVPIQAETILSERVINPETITEAAQAAMEACTPIDDARGSARYRKLMVRNLTRNAVTEVWQLLRQS
jgi:carbon-monoxide dehydrogenase medium subunit